MVGTGREGNALPFYHRERLSTITTGNVFNVSARKQTEKKRSLILLMLARESARSPSFSGRISAPARRGISKEKKKKSLSSCRGKEIFLFSSERSAPTPGWEGPTRKKRIAFLVKALSERLSFGRKSETPKRRGGGVYFHNSAR